LLSDVNIGSKSMCAEVFCSILSNIEIVL